VQGLPAYIGIGTSSVDQALLQRQALQILVASKASDVFSELDTRKISLKLVAEEKSLQQSRMDLTLQEFELGTAVATFDLLTAVQEKFKADVNYSNAMYS